MLPPLILGVSLLVLFSVIRRAGRDARGSAGAPNPLLDGLYGFFVYERPGIVLAQLFVSTALCVRTMRAAFDAADRRVEAVALTLGCTPFGAFLHAALPQATSGILAGAVLSWSYAMGLFAPSRSSPEPCEGAPRCCPRGRTWRCRSGTSRWP